MRDPAAGLMHSLIYWGFLILFLGTVTLEIDHILPEQFQFLEGRVYQGYSAILDLASLMFLGGLAWERSAATDNAPGGPAPRRGRRMHGSWRSLRSSA